MRYSVLALLAALVVAVPVAGATAVKVKPLVEVTAAAKSGKNAKFTISVTLPNAPKCSGRITATRKISKKKSVSWSAPARYTADSHVCTAAIHAKLPRANYGKKLKFTIKFPGSKAVKRFSTTKSLAVKPPPPPAPTPSTGNGNGNGGPLVNILLPLPGKFVTLTHSGPGDGFNIHVQSDGTTALSWPGTFKWYCGDTNLIKSALIYQNWTIQIIGSSGHGSYHWISGNNDVNYDLTVSFSDAHTGSGTLIASGSYDYGAGDIESCHLTDDFTLKGPF